MSEEILTEKRCTKCGEIKPLNDFAKSKNGKHGRRGDCKACFKAAHAQKSLERKKASYLIRGEEIRARERARYANPDIRAKKQAYRKANRESIRAYMQDYYAANREDIRQQQHEYYTANSETILKRNKAYNAENAQVRSEHNRAWREANMDWVREQRKRYREANRDKIREYMREYSRGYRAANRERIQVRLKAYREANTEKIQLYMSDYYEANKEYILVRNQAWRVANPDAYNALCQNRRARLKGNGGKFTTLELKAMRKAQNGICAYCKRQHKPEELTIDHVIPVTQGGRHEASNIVLACGRCNSSKYNRTPEQWTNRWYERKPKPKKGK